MNPDVTILKHGYQATRDDQKSTPWYDLLTFLPNSSSLMPQDFENKMFMTNVSMRKAQKFQIFFLYFQMN